VQAGPEVAAEAVEGAAAMVRAVAVAAAPWAVDSTGPCPQCCRRIPRLPAGRAAALDTLDH